ncbi:MAG: carbohydrate-binding protein, partial [Planctomycetes bacterium]|nr:carbohydrate-binding protein [Planctomycetota bacterium]
GKVLAFESKPDRAVAVIDMTPAYADWAARVQRTFELDRGAEATVTVRDELELKQPEDVYWFMHTRASVAIDADGQRARLELNSKTLYAHLLRPADARFSVLDAAPLPGTPDPEKQARNKGVRRLAVKLEQVSASQIEVVFSASADIPTDANLTPRP